MSMSGKTRSPLKGAGARVRSHLTKGKARAGDNNRVGGKLGSRCETWWLHYRSPDAVLKDKKEPFCPSLSQFFDFKSRQDWVQPTYTEMSSKAQMEINLRCAGVNREI